LNWRARNGIVDARECKGPRERRDGERERERERERLFLTTTVHVDLLLLAGKLSNVATDWSYLPKV
jgi:hypothetical protein